MSQWPITKSDVAYGRLSDRYVRFRVTLVGDTTPANIKAYISDVSGMVTVTPYVESNVQPTPADSEANFPTLDSNAAPATIGILIACGDAKRILSVTTLPLTISSAQMVGGVTAAANLCGFNNTGVTQTTKNVAFVISCTSLDLDSAVANHSFIVEVKYEALQNA